MTKPIETKATTIVRSLELVSRSPSKLLAGESTSKRKIPSLLSLIQGVGKISTVRVLFIRHLKSQRPK
jgi:hypothetical protein